MILKKIIKVEQSPVNISSLFTSTILVYITKQIKICELF